MRLWKIENGIPSLADNFLVAAAPCLVIDSIVTRADPILEFFDIRSLPSYLGVTSLFLLSIVIGGAGLWLFLRNEKFLHSELVAVRRIWGFGLSLGLVSVLGLIVSRIFRMPLTATTTSLSIACAVAYTLVIQWARHRPAQATHASFIAALTLGALGLIAKFLSLILKS